MVLPGDASEVVSRQINICDSILSKLDSVLLTTANFSSSFSNKIFLVFDSCISAVVPDSRKKLSFSTG